MATKALADLYVEKLKDLYSAEQQILKALPKMVKAATHEDLRNAFETHRQQTQTHVERLQQIFEELGKSPQGKVCHGMKGIVEEGAESRYTTSEPPRGRGSRRSGMKPGSGSPIGVERRPNETKKRSMAV